MSQETDPIVEKGVKLLLSNDENSAEDLRAHLQELIRDRYGSKKAQGIASLSPNSENLTASMLGKRKPENPDLEGFPIFDPHGRGKKAFIARS